MRLSARILELPFTEAFMIARGAQDRADVVNIEIAYDGVCGYGEAAPMDRYGESVGSTISYLDDVDGRLGDDPFALEAVTKSLPPGHFAARAAIDAALHDLCGKLVEKPVWRLLGLQRNGPPTSWGISLASPDQMAEKAADATARRFRRLKLKLGGGDGLDIERVRAVRSVTRAQLQIDINEHWTLDEALDTLPALAELGVQYCEQPLPAGHPGGAALRRASPIPIYVDEDCHTLADIARCAEIAHGINVKLTKCGGIREAVRMFHAARALDLNVMLGCTFESTLGIAASAAIASLCDYVDLDGNLFLADDPWRGVELTGDAQLPSDSPGLGIRHVGAEPGQQDNPDEKITQAKRLFR